jgi:hypothetical protein
VRECGCAGVRVCESARVQEHTKLVSHKIGEISRYRHKVYKGPQVPDEMFAPTALLMRGECVGECARKCVCACRCMYALRTCSSITAPDLPMGVAQGDREAKER